MRCHIEWEFCIAEFAPWHHICFIVQRATNLFFYFGEKFFDKSITHPSSFLTTYWILHNFFTCGSSKTPIKSTNNGTNMPSNNRLGVQAKCSILLSHLHPSAIVDTYFPNWYVQKHLQDLVCTKIESRLTTKSIFSINFKWRTLLFQEILHCHWRRLSQTFFQQGNCSYWC